MKINELYSQKDISKKIQEIADKINSDYKGKEIVLIGVLNGATVFLSDLMRKINSNVIIDFISVSSYEGSKSTGVVKLIKDLSLEIYSKDIIIVEDIVDTGLTLDYLVRLFKQRKPNSIRICTLLDKACKREIEIKLDYVGFEIEDVFVVGYGIDYDEKYRNLDYIAFLEEIWN